MLTDAGAIMGFVLLALTYLAMRDMDRQPGRRAR